MSSSVVSVEYGCEVEQPVFLSRFAMRCLTLKPRTSRVRDLFELAARSAPPQALDDIEESIAKRARKALKKPADDDGIFEVVHESSDGNRNWTDRRAECSDTEEDFEALDDEGRKLHKTIRENFNVEVGYYGATRQYNDDGELELTMDDPHTVESCFSRAAKVILGERGSTFEMAIQCYSGHWDHVDNGASISSIRLVARKTLPTDPDAVANVVGEHHSTNLPTGVKRTPILYPSAEEKAQWDADLATLCEELGLVAVSTPDMALITDLTIREM